MAEILTKYLELSDRSTSPRSSGVSDFTHLIWPESPFPVILSRDIEALRRIGAFLPADATLITGAARQEVVGRPNSPSRARYFNSIHVIQAGGVITDTYDKTHLVPFGEYLPFGRVIERLGIRQFVHIPGGFEPGRRRALLQAPNLPRIGPLICYEAIFPGAVAPPVGSGERPGLLLNVTNDAWFGVTPGPHQHFAQARLRAIEEGLPLVRAANSGVSAIIDPYGRILGSLPLGQEDVLDGPLPSPIAPTIYARWPTAAPMALWALALLMALYGALQPRRFTLR
jgi:apolipoprotein N-acyltransferase